MAWQFRRGGESGPSTFGEPKDKGEKERYQDRIERLQPPPSKTGRTSSRMFAMGATTSEAGGGGNSGVESGYRGLPTYADGPTFDKSPTGVGTTRSGLARSQPKDHRVSWLASPSVQGTR